MNAPTVWGVILTAVVGGLSTLVAWRTNKRQEHVSNRSQALVEVQAVWERLDALEERIDKLERWRRKARNYIGTLVAALQDANQPVPPPPIDLDLD